MMIPLSVAGLLKKWWPAFAVAAIFGLLLGTAYCKGQSAGQQGEVVKQQDRELEVQSDLGRANDVAANQRVKDAAEAVHQEKELQDALDTTNDPDRRRALRGCIILRQQGRDTQDIPECQ